MPGFVKARIIRGKEAILRKLRLNSTLLLVFVITLLALSVFSASCAPKATLAPGSSLPLASFTENSVDVSIALTRDAQGILFLTATFAPPPDCHLYGKDLPRTGVDGLGRPTLLELAANSKMQALGALIESVPAVAEDFELATLPVYPIGPVTLSLPVALPAGNEWVEDEVSVTFMACTENACKPPVVGKIVQIRVPGADVLSNP